MKDSQLRSSETDLMQVAWVPATTACYICRIVQDEDLTVLCDGDGCNKEVHLYCLAPPLKQIPDGKWFCDTCSARGTTAALREHFRQHDVTKAQFFAKFSNSELSPDAYAAYLDVLVASLTSIDDLRLVALETVPPAEFGAEDFLGCRVDIWNSVDKERHTGRILAQRFTQVGNVGCSEHLVQFQR